MPGMSNRDSRQGPRPGPARGGGKGRAPNIDRRGAVRGPGSGTGPARTPASGPRTDWGGPEVAEWYDRLVGEEGSEYHREVVLPGVTLLLALRPGERAV